MNEGKLQRIRACHGCPHRQVKAGWDWARCCHPELLAPAEMDRAFWDRSVLLCPEHRWTARTLTTEVTESTENDTIQGDGKTDRGKAAVVPSSFTQAVPSSVRSVPSVVKTPCVFGTTAACCAGKVECRRRDRAVRVVNPGVCAACPDRIGRLRIGAVITACNEGEQVQQTVESLAASVTPDCELHVILVDDGSTDGSCNGLSDRSDASDTRLHAVRHEAPQGVGRSRNHGYQVARELGCHVVSFHDAHMRFGGVDVRAEWATPETQRGGLEHVARKALTSGAILCAGCTGLTPGSNRTWCCDLFYNAKDGLQPKWLHNGRPPEEEWPRSPCMMGAGYVMSSETAARLEAATGALWEDTAGRWGFSEEALSVKAFLCAPGTGPESRSGAQRDDVPILFSRDVVFRHMYRSKEQGNPTPEAHRARWRNVCRATRVLFGPEVYAERFQSFCEKRLPKADVDTIMREASAVPARLGTRNPGLVFSHLCGKSAPITAPHPDLAWIAEAVEAAKALPPNSRILVWRAGEVLPALRAARADVKITCLEWSQHRLQTWHPWCKAHNVYSRQARLTEWANEGARFGRIELAIVGGEMQAECIAAVRRVLAPGGRIICDPSMGTRQVADEWRKAEKAEIEKLGQPSPPAARPEPAAKAAGPRSDTSGPADMIVGGAAHPVPGRAAAPPAAIAGESAVRRTGGLTICLLNWRRPENIAPILECLAGQTLKPRVILWNNSWGDGRPPLMEQDIIWLAIQSSVNLGCFPRWPMLALSGTEFVATLDDDLMFADERVLEDAVAACREECPDGIVGFFGWSEVPGQPYRKGRHHNGTTTGTRCDVMKGRFMLLRRALLDRVPLEIPTLSDGSDLSDASDRLSHREDDLYVSLCVSGGTPGAHLIPARLGKRWKELPQGKVAMAGQPGHYEHRDRALRAIRAWLGGRATSNESRATRQLEVARV